MCMKNNTHIYVAASNRVAANEISDENLSPVEACYVHQPSLYGIMHFSVFSTCCRRGLSINCAVYAFICWQWAGYLLTWARSSYRKIWCAECCLVPETGLDGDLWDLWHWLNRRVFLFNVFGKNLQLSCCCIKLMKLREKQSTGWSISHYPQIHLMHLVHLYAVLHSRCIISCNAMFYETFFSTLQGLMFQMPQ